jgi:hypothetical protein
VGVRHAECRGKRVDRVLMRRRRAGFARPSPVGRAERAESACFAADGLTPRSLAIAAAAASPDSEPVAVGARFASGNARRNRSAVTPSMRVARSIAGSDARADAARLRRTAGRTARRGRRGRHRDTPDRAHYSGVQTDQACLGGRVCQPSHVSRIGNVGRLRRGTQPLGQRAPIPLAAPVTTASRPSKLISDPLLTFLEQL